MPKYTRKCKRIGFEIEPELFEDIHLISESLNITMRAYIYRLVAPDVEERKKLLKEKI